MASLVFGFLSQLDDVKHEPLELVVEIFVDHGLHRLGNGRVADPRLSQVALDPVDKPAAVQDVGDRDVVRADLVVQRDLAGGRLPRRPPAAHAAHAPAGAPAEMSVETELPIDQVRRLGEHRHVGLRDLGLAGQRQHLQDLRRLRGIQVGREQEDFLATVVADQGPLVRLKDGRARDEGDSATVGPRQAGGQQHRRGKKKGRSIHGTLPQSDCGNASGDVPADCRRKVAACAAPLKPTNLS